MPLISRARKERSSLTPFGQFWTWSCFCSVYAVDRSCFEQEWSDGPSLLNSPASPSIWLYQSRTPRLKQTCILLCSNKGSLYFLQELLRSESSIPKNWPTPMILNSRSFVSVCVSFELLIADWYTDLYWSMLLTSKLRSTATTANKLLQENQQANQQADQLQPLQISIACETIDCWLI